MQHVLYELVLHSPYNGLSLRFSTPPKSSWFLLHTYARKPDFVPHMFELNRFPGQTPLNCLPRSALKADRLHFLDRVLQ